MTRFPQEERSMSLPPYPSPFRSAPRRGPSGYSAGGTSAVDTTIDARAEAAGSERRVRVLPVCGGIGGGVRRGSGPKVQVRDQGRKPMPRLGRDFRDSSSAISRLMASNGELLAVAALQRLDPFGEIPVGVHEAPQLHEGAHDGDVDFHRARRAQHAGEHGDALFGEGVGQSADVATRCGHNL